MQHHFLWTVPSMFWSDQELSVIKVTNIMSSFLQKKGIPATVLKLWLNGLKSECDIRMLNKDGTKLIFDICVKGVNIYHPFVGQNWNGNKQTGAKNQT